MKVGFYGGKFMPLHTGHMRTIVQAATMVDKLYVFIFTNRIAEEQITDNPKYLDGDLRASWLGEECANLDNVKVMRIDGQLSDDELERWRLESDKVKDMIWEDCKKDITYCFSGEPTYDDHFIRNYPDSQHVIVDRDRISSTLIRDNLYKHWKFLPPAVRKDLVAKVVLVGTESCGKSTLVKHLAKVYNTNYVQEIGRDFCDRTQDMLTVEMFDEIAMDHLKAERDALRHSNKLLFVDTEAIVTQYYLQVYFERVSAVIEYLAKANPYDLYIYMEPDVEWVDDGLRWMGDKDERKTNNFLLKSMFDDRGIEYHTIKGNYKERLEKAMLLVDMWLQR